MDYTLIRVEKLGKSDKKRHPTLFRVFRQIIEKAAKRRGVSFFNLYSGCCWFNRAPFVYQHQSKQNA